MSRRGHTPLVRLVATGEVGVDPIIMGVGPVDAVRKAVSTNRK